MDARTRIVVLTVFVSISAAGWGWAQTEVKTDVWTPFKFFVGRYLHVTNEARFAPQEKNPQGEVHQDWGAISFDQMRKKYVFRQFHVEGFVNQYLSDGPEADGKTFVFVSEAIENIPPGFRARLTYKILNENEFQQTFELAQSGQDFACYSQGIMKRQGAAK